METVPLFIITSCVAICFFFFFFFFVESWYVDRLHNFACGCSRDITTLLAVHLECCEVTSALYFAVRRCVVEIPILC